MIEQLIQKLIIITLFNGFGYPRPGRRQPVCQPVPLCEAGRFHHPFEPAGGGFLTARLAPALAFYNALMFGIVNLILGLPFSTGLPTWFRVVAFGLLIPAALAGAYWSKWASQPGRRQ